MDVEANLLDTSCPSCACGLHERCEPEVPQRSGGCACSTAGHEHDVCRDWVERKADPGPCGAEVTAVIELGESVPSRRVCARHARRWYKDQMEALHFVRYSRFPRGLTPIAPRRTLWGHSARCACGWTARTNERKEVVVRRYRDHLAQVVPPAKTWFDLTFGNRRTG